MATKHGTNGSDSIYGTTGTDFIYGYDGQDYIFSGGGSGEYIDAGAGADYLNFNGSVNSTALMGSGNDFVEAVLGGNTINGGDGQDKVAYNLYSTSGINVDLSTGKVTTGGMFSFTDSLISIEEVLGTKYADTMKGSWYGDMLDGGEGNDNIDGGSGADKLFGGDGNDVIKAGQGADFIYGGSGVNYIDVGAAGNELARYGEKDIVKHVATNSGPAVADHITNFDVAGNDLIQLFGSSFSSFADVKGAMQQVGADTYIQTGYNSSIILHGVNMNSLTASDFSFV